MRILGIETSCDDTSIALIENKNEQISVIKEVTASQIDIHKIYGGVVPEVAARAHTESIIPLLKEIYDHDNPPDAIAVTAGPGLITSLIVGVETAKTLTQLTGIPLIAVNHMEGHIYSNWIITYHSKQHERPDTENHEISPAEAATLQSGVDITPRIEFPVLALIVSGGHTELVLMTDHLQYTKVGWTVDDAAGEAFDKIGKLIGLEYPGGPKISKLAANGKPDAIDFPRPMLNSGDLNFSFSGLKTAAKNHLEQHRLESEQSLSDFCASFEQAIVDTLVTKTLTAIQQYKPKTVMLGGGVAANKQLRTQLELAIHARNEMLISMYEDKGEKPKGVVRFLAPHIAYTTDNAAMIATAGYFKAKQKKFINPNELNAQPAWELPTQKKSKRQPPQHSPHPPIPQYVE